MSPGGKSQSTAGQESVRSYVGLLCRNVDRRVTLKSDIFDVQAGLERREEEEMTHQVRYDRQGAVSGSSDLSLRSPYSPVRSSPTSPLPSSSVPWNIPPPPPLPASAQTERIPTPTQSTLREQDRESNASTGEESLNAAAAREISRELDALLFRPPPPTSSSVPPPTPPSEWPSIPIAQPNKQWRSVPSRQLVKRSFGSRTIRLSLSLLTPIRYESALFFICNELETGVSDPSQIAAPIHQPSLALSLPIYILIHWYAL